MPDHQACFFLKRANPYAVLRLEIIAVVANASPQNAVLLLQKPFCCSKRRFVAPKRRSVAPKNRSVAPKCRSVAPKPFCCYKSRSVALKAVCMQTDLRFLKGSVRESVDVQIAANSPFEQRNREPTPLQKSIELLDTGALSKASP